MFAWHCPLLRHQVCPLVLCLLVVAVDRTLLNVFNRGFPLRFRSGCFRLARLASVRDMLTIASCGVSRI